LNRDEALKAKNAKEKYLNSEIKPGAYVFLWEEESLARSLPIYGRKLSPIRWTGPWRVNDVLNIVVVVVSWAENPLDVRVVNRSKLKLARLTDQEIARYEQWWTETEAQRQDRRRQLSDRLQDARECHYEYESTASKGGKEKDAVQNSSQEYHWKELLAYDEDRDRVQVRWEGDEITWEPAQNFREDSYQAWLKFYRKWQKQKKSVQ
jgi:hypothetical protein